MLDPVIQEQVEAGPRTQAHDSIPSASVSTPVTQDQTCSPFPGELGPSSHNDVVDHLNHRCLAKNRTALVKSHKSTARDVNSPELRLGDEIDSTAPFLDQSFPPLPESLNPLQEEGVTLSQD